MSESIDEWVADGARLIEDGASQWHGWLLGALTVLIVIGAPDGMSELLAVVIVGMTVASIALIILPGRERCPACDDVIAPTAVHCESCGETVGEGP